MNFDLKAPFKPTGDQPQAITSLVKGIENNLKNQVLLGVTGSGKTFTIANVLAKIQKPVLVISHNKTLAAQLYQEFREFFPNNAVSYFVSYYDFYQPEAYIPQTDTYIEKETNINEEIDKLRLAATSNLLTRKDTIIVASVSCIYNLGSPVEYGKIVLELATGVKINRESIFKRLVDLQYLRNDYVFKRGSFRLRGEFIDVYLAYKDKAIRIQTTGDLVTNIFLIDPLTGRREKSTDKIVIYPAKHYLTKGKNLDKIFNEIRNDLVSRLNELKKQGKILEAHRLKQKVNYDLEMIEETGYINGIENYSRYFDGRKQGEAPFTLIDYFKTPYNNDWLLIIDESHQTLPQLRAMYQGDQSRKQTLIDFGFRLPSALDNRPLTFTEFFQKIPQTIYVSATPSFWEMNLARTEIKKKMTVNYTGITEQLVRPTGIVDPQIVIRPTTNQITDLIKEMIKRKNRGDRILITTLTKKMAEDLSSYLQEKKYVSLKEFINIDTNDLPQVHYLHSDIKTLERSDILDDLRSGKYDALIGINLLREGLDLPEVSLVAILDADKEGFLRSETSLIQTMGRAARHTESLIILYADSITNSMKRAKAEIDRRRNIQINFNKKYNIIPTKISKPIRKKLSELKSQQDFIGQVLNSKKRWQYRKYLELNLNSLTPADAYKFIKLIQKEMRIVASNLNFELAAELRDKITEIRKIFNL